MAKKVTKSSYILFLQDKATELNLSGRKFAEACGLDSGTMSRYLSGQRILSYRHALRISDCLNLRAAERVEFIDSVSLSTKSVDRGERSNDYKEQRKANRKAIPAPKPETPKKGKEETILTEEEKEQIAYIRSATAKLDRSLVLTQRNVTYFITSAMEGGEIFIPGMNAVENFLERKNAQLLIIPSRAHLRPLDDNEYYPLPTYILENHSDHVYRNVNICEVLDVKDMDIRPYVGDPLSGLQEEGADNGTSLIVAHPQQRDKTYPCGVGNLARRQLSTGTITMPRYRKGKSGDLADRNHKLGGIIVEVARGGRFYARHVTFASDGSFCDLGTVYHPDGSTRQIRAAGMNRGDEHVGFTCQKTYKAMDEMIDRYQPKEIYIQDFCESANASHHRERDMMAMLSIPDHVRGLDKELKFGQEQLTRLKNKVPSDTVIYIVPSNHNDHIAKYLGERRYVNDRLNFVAANELAYFYFNLKKDPLQHKIDPEQKLAVWLKRTQTHKCCGVTIHHGDAGMNGSKGSVKQDRVIFGKSSAGHSHSPEKWRDATRVGTSSVLDMDYVEGKPSSWANACELIFESPDKNNPWRQLIYIIDGKYQADFSTKQSVNEAPLKKAKAS